MADAVRVRLYWDDGTVETPRGPIDAAVTMIVRQAKDGTHRHFGVTDDVDADGYLIAIDCPTNRRLSPRSASGNHRYRT